MSLVNTVFGYSDGIQNSRTEASVTNKIIEELFELKDEVFNSDVYGHGEDGVVGEAIDIIICALDLIKLNNPNITEEQLIEIATKKCDKWERLYGEE